MKPRCGSAVGPLSEVGDMFLMGSVDLSTVPLLKRKLLVVASPCLSPGCQMLQLEPDSPQLCQDLCVTPLAPSCHLWNSVSSKVNTGI